MKANGKSFLQDTKLAAIEKVNSPLHAKNQKTFRYQLSLKKLKIRQNIFIPEQLTDLNWVLSTPNWLDPWQDLNEYTLEGQM